MGCFWYQIKIFITLLTTFKKAGNGKSPFPPILVLEKAENQFNVFQWDHNNFCLSILLIRTLGSEGAKPKNECFIGADKKEEGNKLVGKRTDEAIKNEWW